MKQTFMRLPRQNAAFFFAFSGSLLGSLVFLLVEDTLPEGDSLPIQSVLSTVAPFSSLIGEYAQEVKLFLFPLCFSFAVRHPLPLLTGVLLRGFYQGVATAAVFSQAALSGTVFFLLHAAALLSHACFAHVALPLLPKSAKLTWEKLFPLAFYAGVIFLLTLVRNLVYYLLF